MYYVSLLFCVLPHLCFVGKLLLSSVIKLISSHLVLCCQVSKLGEDWQVEMPHASAVLSALDLVSMYSR